MERDENDILNEPDDKNAENKAADVQTTADADEKEEREQGQGLMSKKIITVLAVLLLVVSLASVPTFAWFYTQKKIAAYIPISTPEALFIGTGQEEDIRYLYFKGIDVKSEGRHIDYVISIRGIGISSYKLQLGYTTNNQFNYELYPVGDEGIKTQTQFGEMTPADQSSYLSGVVAEYTPNNGDLPKTYYKATGGALAMTYLNRDGTAFAAGTLLATDSYHDSTYGTYDSVQKNAEPIYCQTTTAITLASREEFTHYYVLHVSWSAARAADGNNRETDVICIAAKVA